MWRMTQKHRATKCQEDTDYQEKKNLHLEEKMTYTFIAECEKSCTFKVEWEI